MNPFDWRGPQFLLFYIVLSIAVFVAVRWLRNRRELMDGAGYRGTPMHDPYAIAFLRGGKHELLRVAVVSMVDRGLLSAKNDQLETTTVGRGTKPRRLIERELLDFCAIRREPKELFSGAAFDVAAGEIEHELAEMRMMPDEETTAARWKLFYRGAAVLLFFSVLKIVVALARGRGNIGFLIILSAIALIVLERVAVRGRTARGDAFLKEMENLFRSLKLRAAQLQPGGATSEVAMLAAVFGVTALPRNQFAWSSQLFPQASSGASSSGSCGSSCGSSCGGGCGGGGCGGCGG